MKYQQPFMADIQTILILWFKNYNQTSYLET